MRSFSGTHDWHPTVLDDTDAVIEGNADEIIWNIENGRCPRCERPLPQPPEFPAGSRITRCRSIPICGPCGSDEVHEAVDCVRGIGWGISSAACWPIPIEKIHERHDRIQQQMEMVPAILTGDGHLITEDGATPVVTPRNTGGWAEYGGAP